MSTRTMIDFEKICRTCSSEGDLQSLFVEDTYVLADMLNQITNIKVEENDNYPQNICLFCLEKLKISYYFIQQCLEVDIKLKEHLNSVNETFEFNDITTKEENIYIELKNEPEDDYQTYSTIEYYVDETISTDVMEDIKPIIPLEESKVKKKRKRDYQQNIVCNICDKTVRKGNFWRHLKLHSGERKFACPRCGKDFTQKVSLQAHMLTHTGERPYKCNRCDVDFKQRVQLLYHMRSKHVDEIKPTSDGKFECNRCNEKFSSQEILSSHKLSYRIRDKLCSKATSSQNKAHLCNHCGKSFHDNCKFQDHLRSHTGEKRYKCNSCDKSFIHYNTFHRHRKTHEIDKAYKCSVCEKGFITKVALNVHELIHTGDKPHSCDKCKQSFRQQAHLKRHMLTHTGETPHQCSHCDKAFAVKGNLTVHLRMHTGETPYVCSICDKGFYDSSSMKRHKKKHLLVEDENNENEKSFET